MATFKKKQLDESVGGDIFADGSDRNVTNNSEIETGPVEKPYNDNSDYEKGMATTTDKVFGRYRQNIPWFAVYSFGGFRGSGLPISEDDKKKTIIKKKAVEEKIEDLVKKSKNSDVTDKNYNPKLAKMIDTINDVDLTDAQIEDLKKALEAKKNENKPKNI
jgi:hypothetical protein